MSKEITIEKYKTEDKPQAMENKAGTQRTHKGQRYQGTSTGDAGETDEPAKSEDKAQTGKGIHVSESSHPLAERG